ncbi:MAG: relaxase domain-containing protein [Nocardioidaceae bacterium]
MPVEQIEAAVVRQYTSRAGDPHRHLHLQINAKVFAVGQWRALHSVGTRDNIEAINGMCHAAVMCDPELRATFAAHGYTLDADGEVRELAPYVGRFSQRSAQITRNVDRYEAQWRADHPGQEAGSAAASLLGPTRMGPGTTRQGRAEGRRRADRPMEHRAA